MDMLSGLVPHSMSHFLSALIHQKAGRGAAAEGQIIRRRARKQTRAPSLASSLALVLLLLWLLTQLFCSFLQDNIKMWRVHRSNLEKSIPATTVMYIYFYESSSPESTFMSIDLKDH